MSLFLAIEHGDDFAAAAAVGSIASALAASVYALVYARTATRGWPYAVAAASVAWALFAFASRAVSLPPLVTTLIVWAGLALIARAMPRPAPLSAAPRAARWDLPARMVVATALVLGVTAAAPVLGPFMSGMLAGFPVYATVLAVFAQRVLGPDAGMAVMRGLTAGVFAFATFFFVIATMLPSFGITVSFIVATAAILLVQALSLVLLRREARAAWP